MKNIIYSFIAIFILSIVAVSFTIKKNHATSVIIQSVDKNISPVNLSKSVQIISDRLKSFSSENFDVAANPPKNQIKVSFTGKWDLRIAVRLLVQKGEIGFYECYSRAELSGLLNGDGHLFNLLNSDDKNAGEFRIGCASLKNMSKVDDFTSTLRLKQGCKFAWSETKNTGSCLYALKVNEDKNALLEGKDILEVKPGKPGNYTIEIRFRKPAIDLWADATKRNINKPIAIVLDGKVIYAPILKSEINEGLCSISGNFTETDVNYFAAIGNNGVLPSGFKEINQKQ